MWVGRGEWGVGTSVGMSMVSWVWGVGGVWVGRRVWVGCGEVCGHVDGKLGVYIRRGDSRAD